MSGSTNVIKPPSLSPENLLRVTSATDSVPKSNASDASSASATYPQPQPPSVNEFLEVSQKITQHNLIIDDLKRRIHGLNARTPITYVEQQELTCLQSCLQKEMRSLNALIQMTIERQSERPDQPWGAIPMSTTLEEDLLPHIMFYPPESFKTAPPPERKATTPNPTSSTGSVQAPEAVAAAKAADMLDHEQLQADIRYRDMMIECLQQKMRCLREEMQKICKLSKRPQPCIPCPGRSPVARVQKKICCPVAATNQLQDNAMQANCMQEQLNQMTQVLNQLQLELTSVQKERGELDRYRKSGTAGSTTSDAGSSSPYLEQKNPCGLPSGVGGASSRSPCTPCMLPCGSPCLDAHEELHNQHTTLLGEYAKRDREVRYLREKLAALDAAASAGKTGGESIESVQIDILNQRIAELRDEEDEFKHLITEQQHQIGEYRGKFLQAQQTVVEQRTCIDSMELSKQQIEEQINCEVQRIQARFQEKLRDLAPLPKLLESEKFRVQTLKQENEDLVTQIGAMTSQLRKARKDVKRLNAAAGGGDNKRQSAEMNALKRQQELAEQEKRDLAAQLHLCKDELQCIQTETQKTMLRNKERSECSRDALQTRINRLEIELAESRAKSSLKLADRDEVIQNMQEQLNELSCNFGNAQKQIRSLKRRIGDLAETDVRESGCPC